MLVYHRVMTVMTVTQNMAKKTTRQVTGKRFFAKGVAYNPRNEHFDCRGFPKVPAPLGALISRWTCRAQKACWNKESVFAVMDLV